MVELTKSFLRFIAEVITTLMIFAVVFSPEGIASATYNNIVYAEPILLQNHIASALMVGSQAPGYFTTDVKTSGQPHIIEISKNLSTGIIYVNVTPAQEVYLKTKFASIEPTPVITNCEIPDKKIKLQRDLIQTITIRKTSFDCECTNGDCKLCCELTVII